jgi:hypothetical protein
VSLCTSALGTSARVLAVARFTDSFVKPMGLLSGTLELPAWLPVRLAPHQKCVLAYLALTQPEKLRARSREYTWTSVLSSLLWVSVHGAVGFALLIDEFTDEWFVYPIQGKDEVDDILAQFKLAAERHFRECLGAVLWPLELAGLRSDGEAVLVQANITAWCAANGIRHEVSAPYITASGRMAKWNALFRLSGKAQRLYARMLVPRLHSGPTPFWLLPTFAAACPTSLMASRRGNAGTKSLCPFVVVLLTFVSGAVNVMLLSLLLYARNWTTRLAFACSWATVTDPKLI